MNSERACSLHGVRQLLASIFSVDFRVEKVACGPNLQQFVYRNSQTPFCNDIKPQMSDAYSKRVYESFLTP